jgi:alpha-N-acetylglucosamine transferase
VPAPEAGALLSGLITLPTNTDLCPLSLSLSLSLSLTQSLYFTIIRLSPILPLHIFLATFLILFFFYVYTLSIFRPAPTPNPDFSHTIYSYPSLVKISRYRVIACLYINTHNILSFYISYVDYVHNTYYFHSLFHVLMMHTLKSTYACFTKNL